MIIHRDTKKVLANSLIQLSETTKIEKITIQNIVNHCGAGRQTFYNHFKDKYDLINWIYAQEAEEILDIFFQTDSWYESIRQIFLLFLNKKQFFINVYKMIDQNYFMEFFIQHTKDYYINSIIKRFGEKEITPDLLFTIEFDTYGAVNMHAKWVRGGMKESAEVMANHIIRNMPADLKKYFI